MTTFKSALLSIVFVGLVVITLPRNVLSQYGATGVTFRGMINREILKQSLPKRRSVRKTRTRSKRATTPKAPKKSSLALLTPKGKTRFQMGQLIIANRFYQNSAGTEQQRTQGYNKLKAHWDRYISTANKDGFPPYDLAYALEYYLVTNYLAYSDYYDPNKGSKRSNETQEMFQRRIGNEITIPVEEKIYWQFKSFMEKSDFLNKLSDQEKQLLAESLITVTGNSWEIYRENYNGNSAQKKQAMKTAEANLTNLLGFSPEKLIFFEEGFTLVD